MFLKEELHADPCIACMLLSSQKTFWIHSNIFLNPGEECYYLDHASPPRSPCRRTPIRACCWLASARVLPSAVQQLLVRRQQPPPRRQLPLVPAAKTVRRLAIERRQGFAAAAPGRRSCGGRRRWWWCCGRCKCGLWESMSEHCASPTVWAPERAVVLLRNREMCSERSAKGAGSPRSAASLKAAYESRRPNWTVHVGPRSCV